MCSCNAFEAAMLHTTKQMLAGNSSVYDAIHLLEHTGIRPRPRSDFGLRSIESLAEKLSSCCEEAQSNACVLGGVLVQNPFSVSIVFYRCGTVVLFDSHIHGSHGSHGAAVAILPHTCMA
eukprot:scpid84415/ scgid19685/ 